MSDNIKELIAQIKEGRTPKTLREGHMTLPNGCALYWETNAVGCRRYSSDEVGGGVHIWDTALVDVSSLLSAMTQEMALQKAEAFLKEKKE